MITAAAKAIHVLPQATVAYWQKAPYRAQLVDRGGALYGSADNVTWRGTA